MPEFIHSIDVKAAVIAVAGAAATLPLLFYVVRLLFSDNLPEKRKEEKPKPDDGYAHNALNDIMGYDFIRIVNIEREEAKEKPETRIHSFAESRSPETRTLENIVPSPVKTTGAETVGQDEGGNTVQTPHSQNKEQQEEPELSENEIEALYFNDSDITWEENGMDRNAYEENLDKYMPDNEGDMSDIDYNDMDPMEGVSPEEREQQEEIVREGAISMAEYTRLINAGPNNDEVPSELYASNPEEENENPDDCPENKETIENFTFES